MNLDNAELEVIASRIIEAGRTSDLLALLMAKAQPAIRVPDYVVGPFRVRCMRLLDAGSWIEGHTHNYGHDTIVHEGSVLMEYYPCGPDKKPLNPGIPAKSIILGGKGRAKSAYIEANTWHKFIALEPNTDLRCYYVHRDEFGKIVPDYNEREESYV